MPTIRKPIHIQDLTATDRAALAALRDQRDDEDSASPTRTAAIVQHDTLLDAFKQRYGVDERTTGSVCVSRLLGGQCTRGYRNGHTGPHEMPHTDHTDLWLRDGEPAVYTAHLYDLPWSYLRDIVEFAETHGLAVDIDAGLSWYFPGATVLVALTPGNEYE